MTAEYIIAKQVGGAWGVYIGEVAPETLMSGHHTEEEAKEAVKRYKEADRRRRG